MEGVKLQVKAEFQKKSETNRKIPISGVFGLSDYQGSAPEDKMRLLNFNAFLLF